MSRGDDRCHELFLCHGTFLCGLDDRGEPRLGGAIPSAATLYSVDPHFGSEDHDAGVRIGGEGSGVVGSNLTLGTKGHGALADHHHLGSSSAVRHANK
jgi:hypothetical protein